MSRTQGKTKRQQQYWAHKDVFPTPAGLCLAICQHLGREMAITPGRILEPSAGSGAFVRAARMTWPSASVFALEVRAECDQGLIDAGADTVACPADLTVDAQAAYPAVPYSIFDLVLGNPPFLLAEDHIRVLLNRMKQGSRLAFLLRVAFFESQSRVPFWREFPLRALAPIIPRPSFGLNKHGKPGTDATAYGLFVWEKGFAGRGEILPAIVWNKKIEIETELRAVAQHEAENPLTKRFAQIGRTR